MNADSAHSSILSALLDGTLDAAGEQEALNLLTSDPAARAEFARLSQMHLWLADDKKTRSALRASTMRRKIIRHPAWWLAAAVAAAVIIFTATRLWPAPGSSEGIAARDRIRPLLAVACAGCHEQVDQFLAGTAATGLAMIVPGEPEHSAVWLRVSGENPCAGSLTAVERSMLYHWILGA